MPKRSRLTIEKVAELYADSVLVLVHHFYCTGAASVDELRAASADWVEGWLAELRKDIAPGTICPSRR